MIIKYHQLLKPLLVLTLISMMGCASQDTKLIPSSGENILQIYKDHMASTEDQPKMFRQLRNDRRDLMGYTRTAANETSLEFPLLPNPELSVYIFPHMSRKGHPIPGYSTTFMMYKKDEFAMPGELIK